MQTILFSGAANKRRSTFNFKKYKPSFEVKVSDSIPVKVGEVRDNSQSHYLIGGELRVLSRYSGLNKAVRCLKPSIKSTKISIARVADSIDYSVKNYFHIASSSKVHAHESGYYYVLVTELLDADCMDAIKATKAKFVIYGVQWGNDILESVEDDIAYLGIPEDTYVLWDYSQPLTSAASCFNAIKYASSPRRNASLFNQVKLNACNGMVDDSQHQGMDDDEACFQLFSPELLESKMEANKYKGGSLMMSLKHLQENIPNGRINTCPIPEDFNTIFDDLRIEYPNFKQVIDYLRDHLTLEQLGSNPRLNFGAPILIDGPPGIGKSSFLMMLSELLGTYFCNIACASASNGFDIKGLSSGYNGGKMGHVYQTLSTGKVSNPIILLDEVEKGKVCSNAGSSIHSVLYELLEPINAKVFKDEFIDLTLDASQIIWFATCNNVDELPDPIKDRFSILSVPAPTAQELRGIVQKMYSEYVEKKGFKAGKVSTGLDEQVISVLTRQCQSIREMDKALRKGLGCAVKRTPQETQVVIEVVDLEYLETIEQPSTGLVLH